MTLETVLFQALGEVRKVELPAGIPSSGTKFEDFMVQQLHHALRQSGMLLFPPRYALHEPTQSGLAHQFDIIVRDTELVGIECKFRKSSGIDDLFAFVGKLTDYQKSPRGIFVTTAGRINDDVLCYALAHRILLVCRSLPPVEYMIERAKGGTDLARRLASLQERLRQGQASPHRLLIEWRNAFQRFTVEGYWQ